MENVVEHNSWHLSKRKIENCLFKKWVVEKAVFFFLNHFQFKPLVTIYASQP